MTLNLTIEPDVEARLRAIAAATGVDVNTYAAQLLREGVAKVTLEETLAPLRKEFANAGVSDEELAQQITQAQSAYRADKRKTA